MRQVATGAPINEPQSTQDNNVSQQQNNNTPSVNGIVKWKDSTFPVVEIPHVKPHPDGPNLQVYGRIKNEWHDFIMLDKIHIFGVVRELDTYLRPGEEREFLLYKGPSLKKQYPEAYVDYKTKQEGDYFRAVFRVTFAYHSSDGTYEVSDLHLHKPIRDIYE